ncbi:MAG: nucleotidyltransferase domain-containing protein [Chloroflexi bacterium]|nr:nucleotidyltransferase domain-containing protein [Chloroflexota bacterium]
MAEIRTETIEDMIEKVQKLLSALRSEGLNIMAAYLYGSQAVKMSHGDSDIDVAIVSPDLSGDHLEDWCRLNRVATRIDVRMEVIGFRPEQFRDEHPLAWEVKTQGVRLA